MAKFLKITDNRGVNHVVPEANRSFWLSYNNRMKPADRVKIKEIYEEDIKDVPYKDPDFISPTVAQSKVGELIKDNEEKDLEIIKLKQQLAALQNGITPALTPPILQDAEPKFGSIDDNANMYVGEIPTPVEPEEITPSKKKK